MSNYGNIQLKDWNSFYEKDLKLILNIGGDSIIDKVTDIHEQGYNYLISEQQDILMTILNTVYGYYSTWQDEYGYDEEEKKKFMPNISNSKELKSLLYPEKIFIMDVELKRFPYIGIQLKCKWDKEHGVGIMLYKNRFVKVGGQDTAFMSWIAEEDKNVQ